jgi:hypothetical protein
MADAPQRVVFIARACVDVDANAGEVAGKGLGSNADAIRERGDLVELDGVLDKGGKLETCTRGRAMFRGPPAPRQRPTPGPDGLHMLLLLRGNWTTGQLVRESATAGGGFGGATWADMRVGDALSPLGGDDYDGRWEENLR